MRCDQRREELKCFEKLGQLKTGERCSMVFLDFGLACASAAWKTQARNAHLSRLKDAVVLHDASGVSETYG